MEKLVLAEYAHAARTVFPVLWYEALHHQPVCFQQIVCGVRVKCKHQLIGFIGIENFLYLHRIAQDAFAVQYGRHLIKRQRILLYRKG